MFLEITGKPGVGKSFLIDSFRDLLGPKVTILCQTGKAAVNVKGSTINKTFGIPINMHHYVPLSGKALKNKMVDYDDVQ